MYIFRFYGIDNCIQNLLPKRCMESYKNLTKTQHKFDQTDGLWQTVSKWNEKSDGWMNDPFSTVNAEALNTDVQGFVKEAFSAHKKVRTKTETNNNNNAIG